MLISSQNNLSYPISSGRPTRYSVPNFGNQLGPAPFESLWAWSCNG